MKNGKEKYIGAFLDGYFHDKELDYNLLYFKIRDKAEKLAKKKWKKYKNQFKDGGSSIEKI